MRFRLCRYLFLIGKDCGRWCLDSVVSFAGMLASLDENLTGTVIGRPPLREGLAVSVRRGISVVAQL